MDTNIQLLYKPIVTLYECNECGIVENFFISSKFKCKFIETSNNVSYVLDTNKIKSFKEDSVIISNKSVLKLKETLALQLSKYFKPLKSKVYTLDGKYLGIVTDIILEGNFDLESLVLEEGTKINKSQIFNLSEDLILVNQSSKIRKKSSFKPKKVQITKVNNYDISTDIKKIKIQSETPNPLPKTTYSKILLNRVVTKNIININGEIIAKANTKISLETINKARLFGKLYELIKYSLPIK